MLCYNEYLWILCKIKFGITLTYSQNVSLFPKPSNDFQTSIKFSCSKASDVSQAI